MSIRRTKAGATGSKLWQRLRGDPCIWMGVSWAGGLDTSLVVKTTGCCFGLRENRWEQGYLRWMELRRAGVSCTIGEGSNRLDNRRLSCPDTSTIRSQRPRLARVYRKTIHIHAMTGSTRVRRGARGALRRREGVEFEQSPRSSAKRYFFSTAITITTTFPPLSISSHPPPIALFLDTP